MRVLIAILTIVFSAAIIGVTLMNASETVNVRLWGDDPAHTYTEVPLWIVLFAAAFAGFLFTGIVAVIEGMKLRLDNARLTRQVRRLRAELEAIRTPALPPGADEDGSPRRDGEPVSA